MTPEGLIIVFVLFVGLIGVLVEKSIKEESKKKALLSEQAFNETGKHKKDIYSAIRNSVTLKDSEKEMLNTIVIPQLSSLGFLHIIKSSDVSNLDGESIEKLKLISQNGLLVKNKLDTVKSQNETKDKYQ